MKPLETLKHYFGYDSFRGIQADIVRSILEGHDTLGLMPTGGGKSITFQVPALMMDGVCIVITPLISLMNDQVTHLRQRGIKAEAIYSGLTRNEIQRILDNAIYGAVKFLYVSPERLHSQLFLSKLYYMKVCFFTVDEAHCISQWGYDFRPSYLEIARIRELKPEAPVLALTATATPVVVRDIQQKLLFNQYPEPSATPADGNVFRMSFRRDNLSYIVRHTYDKEGELVHILKSVPGSAIVYLRSRKGTKEIANLLNKEGINATYYHAGLDVAIKDTRQKEWQEDKTRVMVATNAFGMGIDKPDVRLVIHFSCPDSIEEYFQEAGRGGRDGKRSYAVLLHEQEDSKVLRLRTSSAFPSKDQIRTIYDHLAYFFQLAVDSGLGARYEFDEEIFCYRFHHYPSVVDGALSVLQKCGYIEYEPEPDSQPRIMFSVQRNELYDIRGLTKVEDDIITLLLRYYGSLFSELTYVNENYIVQKLGIDMNHLHVVLKSLAQKHIIRYVQKRSVPVITYTQQRIDSSRLRFSKECYDDLKDNMEKRITAMLHYIEEDDTCRSTMLLDYFGEKNTEDCHHCDVCLQRTHQNDRDKSDEHDSPVCKVRRLLSDGKRHLATEIYSLPLTESERENVVNWLRNSNNITFDGTFIILQE